MRHQKSGNALGVSPAHRRAMLRNLVTAVLEHGRITTTLPRAKEMRRSLDKMIGLGKRGDLHARRQALSFVKSKLAMAHLFGEYAERYQDRPGGYARVLRLGHRHGDGAQLALVQLVDHDSDPFAGTKPKPKGRGRSRRRGGGERAGARRQAAPAETQGETMVDESAAEAHSPVPEPKRRRGGRRKPKVPPEGQVDED